MRRARLHREARPGVVTLKTTTARGHGNEGGKRGLAASDKSRSFNVQATSKSLAIVGALLDKHEGTLHRRPLTKYGRKLPAGMWDRCQVSMHCGSLTIAVESGSALRRKGSFNPLGGMKAAPQAKLQVEAHEVSQIVKIEYANRGERMFKIYVRDVGNQYSHFNEAPKAALGLAELHAAGRKRDIPVAILEFKASSAELAQSWIHNLLLEVSAHAKLTAELAKMLLADEPNAPAIESLLRRAITLWTLAFGANTELVAQTMRTLAKYLLTQPNRRAEAAKMQAAIARVNDPWLARFTAATHLAALDSEEELHMFQSGGAMRRGSAPSVSSPTPSKPSLLSSASAWSLLGGAKASRHEEAETAPHTTPMDEIRSMAYDAYLTECELKAKGDAEEAQKLEELFEDLNREQRAGGNQQANGERRGDNRLSSSTYLEMLESLI